MYRVWHVLERRRNFFLRRFGIEFTLCCSHDGDDLYEAEGDDGGDDDDADDDAQGDNSHDDADEGTDDEDCLDDDGMGLFMRMETTHVPRPASPPPTPERKQRKLLNVQDRKHESATQH